MTDSPRQQVHSAAVAIWTAEHFTGSRADAWRAAELQLGIVADMFQTELCAAEAQAGEFYAMAGELF